MQPSRNFGSVTTVPNREMGSRPTKYPDACTHLPDRVRKEQAGSGTVPNGNGPINQSSPARPRANMWERLRSSGATGTVILAFPSRSLVSFYSLLCFFSSLPQGDLIAGFALCCRRFEFFLFPRCPEPGRELRVSRNRVSGRRQPVQPPGHGCLGTRDGGDKGLRQSY